MLAGIEDLAYQVNGIFDPLDGGNRARLQRGSVHDDGVELNTTVAVEMRADTSIENDIVLKQSDGGFDRIQRRATFNEYFTASLEGAFNAGTAIRDGSIRNVPCTTMDDEGKIRRIHVRKKTPWRRAANSGSPLGGASEKFAISRRMLIVGRLGAKFRTHSDCGGRIGKCGTRDRTPGFAAIALGFFPSVINAMDDGEIGTKSENEQSDGERGRKPVEERSKNQQTETLRALPKTDAAALDKRFSTSLRVANHDGTGHHETREQRVKEAIHRGIVNKKPEENGQVGIAMENGLEEGIKKADARLAMGERAGDKVTCRCGNHGNAGGEKASRAEENSCNNAKNKAGKGENAGGDASPGESSHGALEHPTKGPAEDLDANRHTWAPGRL